MGSRVRAGAGVEPRALARLAPARAPRARRHPVAGPRPEPRLPRRAGAVGASTRTPRAFWWIEPNDADANVIAFARASADGERVLVFVANLSPVPRSGYRLGLPRAGRWREAINTDSTLLRRLATSATSAASSPSRSRGTASRCRPRSRCRRSRRLARSGHVSSSARRALAVPWERAARRATARRRHRRVPRVGAARGVDRAASRPPRARARRRRATGSTRPSSPAQPGDDYWFVLDGRRLPDPCSRWQPKGLRGPSRVLDDHARPTRSADARDRPSS